MAAPLSQDLRRRLVQAVEAGSSAREAALRFALSESAAIKLVRCVRQTGSPAPARIGGYRKPLLAGHEELLRELVTVKDHITLAKRGIEAGCLITIWSTLRRLGLSHKKQLESRRAGPARCGRVPPNVARVATLHGPGALRVRRRNRSRNQHGRTTTFVAGLRSTGPIAPLMLDGPMNGPAFLAYVEQFLAPTLQQGDVVVMDNLAAHEVAGVAEAIRAVGASIFYLPPYSPDLNPIEQAFSMLKSLLRATAARTKEALWTTIGQLLDRFSLNECRNYFANSGDEVT